MPKKVLIFSYLDTKCTTQVQYYAIYQNVNAEKLKKTELYKDDNRKIINFNSSKCKNTKTYVNDVINDLDKITFRNLEGFMKAEKIKYYK